VYQQSHTIEIHAQRLERCWSTVCCVTLFTSTQPRLLRASGSSHFFSDSSGQIQ